MSLDQNQKYDMHVKKLRNELVHSQSSLVDAEDSLRSKYESKLVQLEMTSKARHAQFKACEMEKAQLELKLKAQRSYTS